MTNPYSEINHDRITRDIRPLNVRISNFIFYPAHFKILLIILLGLEIYLPVLWLFWSLLILFLTVSFTDQKFTLPLRIPKDLKVLDSSDYYESIKEENFLFGLVKKNRIVRKLRMAEGILYLGYLRSINEKQGQELWITNSDARTHMFLAGTTGSGKSETLMSIFTNAILWGAGACYGDGKADNNLGFCLWSLSRRFGREDDFLVLNYLTGGSDPFQVIADKEKGKVSGINYQSNSMNSFAEGSADFLLQLMASLLPKAGGDGAQWQQKALNMIDALLRTLAYLRAKGEIDISIGVIRHYLSLQNLVTFYLDGKAGKIPELAFLPIKAYFETGLPGFNPDLAEDPTQWDPEVFNQHGYLTGQFSRILSMLMDTYGFIFSDKYPEIDMLDVLLNNRLLVVMIPSMEKSSSEAAALGKLYISSIRLMMAQNLGYQLEGNKADVLESKATNSPHPSIIICDELAYYFAEGIAVMFAQARSLGFMLVAAAQDVQGLKKGEAADESASMLANTKIKWTLALEDPQDTYELIKKAGGESYYSVLAGNSETGGLFSRSFKAKSDINYEKKERITLSELKKLNSGEGLIIFKDAVVPCNSFYIPDDDKKTSKLTMKINRFLQIERPSMHRLPKHSLKNSEKRENKQLYSCLIDKKRTLPRLNDKILTELVKTMKKIEACNTISIEYQGIVYFETVKKYLKEFEENGEKKIHSSLLDEDQEITIPL